MKDKVVGLKELRENIDTYIKGVKKGKSFVVMRRNESVFKISSPDDEDDQWERVIDFTKIRKGGVSISDLLSRL